MTAARMRRQHQVFERAGRQRDKRIDLLGHAHGADLGSDGGGAAPGDHEPREHRTELARHRKHDDLRHEAFRAEAIAVVICRTSTPPVKKAVKPTTGSE